MSPGPPSRPPAGNRPGRALRRKALGGSVDDGGPDGDDVDVPRAVVDPRAVRFRAALSNIPDLEHDEVPAEVPDPPPTSTSQQVIDLDAIPVAPRLPNTAEVDLAERLKKVPDGTPLPAVRTRLARPSRARTSLEDGGLEDGSTEDEPSEGHEHTGDGADPNEAPALDGAVIDDEDLFEPAEEVGEAPATSTEVRSARTRTRAEHTKSDGGSRSKSRARRAATSAPPRPPWWRRAGFALVLVALVAAVPVLFVAGYRTVTRSTDGRLITSSLTREDPGYEELVTSTPTAVLTQLDAEGTPVGHTLLSLSTNGGGGAVVFMPLDTELAEPAFGVTTLRTVVTMSPRPPAEVRGGVVPQIAKLVNVGIDESFELDEAGWAQMTAPIGAIDIHNPDPVEVLGELVDAGPASLRPDQIGGYLAATRWGETQLNQFVRHEAVWRAWLAKVGASSDPGVVPGESDAGLGLFIRTLAAGPVTYITLPGDFGDDGIYRSDEDAVRDLVVDHIPVPAPPRPGARVTVRVLNGVEPSEPSDDLIRQIVANRASISVVGNAASFDRDVTDIAYSDPEMESAALYLGTVLGIGGDIRLDPTSSDEVDLTLIVGRDLHDPAGGT